MAGPAAFVLAATCGNNLLEPPEQCDGADLGGLDCTTIPGSTYTGGTLNCNPDCTFNTNQCFQAESVNLTATVPGCGDGICNNGETCTTCPADCITGCGTPGVFHNECDYTAQQCVSKPGSAPDQCNNAGQCICSPHGDINKDNLIDITDFSILMYNWGMPLDWNQTPPVLPPYTQPPYNKCSDISHFIPPFAVNGTVDLQDFSIMLYWWTGS